MKDSTFSHLRIGRLMVVNSWLGEEMKSALALLK